MPTDHRIPLPSLSARSRGCSTLIFRENRAAAGRREQGTGKQATGRTWRKPKLRDIPNPAAMTSISKHTQLAAPPPVVGSRSPACVRRDPVFRNIPNSHIRPCTCSTYPSGLGRPDRNSPHFEIQNSAVRLGSRRAFDILPGLIPPCCLLPADRSRRMSGFPDPWRPASAAAMTLRAASILRVVLTPLAPTPAAGRPVHGPFPRLHPGCSRGVGQGLWPWSRTPTTLSRDDSPL